MTRPAALLATLGLTLAGLALPGAVRAQHEAPAAAHEAGGHDEEKLDPIHHSSDGFYMDFEPVAQVELPRMFVVRRADGALGFDAFGSTAAALRSGQYVAEAPAGAEAPGRAPNDTIEDSVLTQMTPHAEMAAGAARRGRRRADRRPTSTWRRTSCPRRARSCSTSRSRATPCSSSWAHSSCSPSPSPWPGATRRAWAARAPRGAWPRTLSRASCSSCATDIARPNIGEKADKFVPYLLTAFFFILILNFLGLLPFGATATANIAVTTILALCTFFATQIFASKDHWKHVFWPPGVPTFVKPILIPVEIMGLFTKPFALAIRLFANMTAGHLVILNLIGLIFVFTASLARAPAWPWPRWHRVLAVHLPARTARGVPAGVRVHHALGHLHRHGRGQARARTHHVDHHDGHGDHHEHGAGEVYDHNGNMALTV